MVIEITAIFKTASAAHAAAKYLGFIQDQLAFNIQKLTDSELEAGIRAMQQASESEMEQGWLLREARARFNKAISFENGLRLALTHLGLAVCHWHLGDRTNAKHSIDNLLSVEPPRIPIAAAVAEKIDSVPYWVAFIFPAGEIVKALAPAAAKALKRQVVVEQTKLADLKRSAAEVCASENWEQPS